MTEVTWANNWNGVNHRYEPPVEKPIFDAKIYASRPEATIQPPFRSSASVLWGKKS